MIRSALVIALVLASGWSYTAWQASVIALRHPAVGAFVTLGSGARIHYTERRPSGGPIRATVILLHGASGNQADMMLPLGDRLAGLGFRVLAPDRPGHGWSDRPGGAVDAWPARQVEVLREAMTRLGVDHAIVVGHSWAGAMAADFALDQPDFTQGLVLLSPVLYPWPTGIAWYYGPVTTPVLGVVFTHLLTLPLGQLSIDAGVNEVFAPQQAPPEFVERTGVTLVLRPAEFMANAQDVSSLHAFVTGQAPRMPSIAVPTAIVTGDGDRIVSPALHAAHAARDIPGASLVVLPGIGHSPHWAAPDKVIAAILDVAGRIDHDRPIAAQ